MKFKMIIITIIFLFFAAQIILFGQSWMQQTSGTTSPLNDIHMINENEGWICGDNGVLLHTTNGGDNWNQVNVTANDIQSVVFNNSQIGILSGDDGNIFRTTNGGNTWNAVSSGTTSNLAEVSWGTGDIVFIAGRDGAAVLSTDAGASWSFINTSSTARFRASATMGSNLWVGGEDGIIKFSSNMGQTWTTQFNPANNDIQDMQFFSQSTGFAGGSSDNLLFTSSSGANWESRAAGIINGVDGIHFLDENIGWAVGIAGTVYSTTNAGINWNSDNVGTSAQLNEVYFVHQGLGWVVSEEGFIFKFVDPNIPVELTSFTAAILDGKIKLEWETVTETNNKGFEIQRKSNLSGQQSVSGNSDLEGYTKIGFVDGSGTTTEKQFYNFIDENVEAGNYLYRLKQIDFDGQFEYSKTVEITVGNPVEFNLAQNYPNPFNPSTVISYQLPEESKVVLKVYNILGSEVATLVNETKAAGNYNVNFNASGLSTGIYIYKLQTGEYTKTMKMNLIK